MSISAHTHIALSLVVCAAGASLFLGLATMLSSDSIHPLRPYATVGTLWCAHVAPVFWRAPVPITETLSITSDPGENGWIWRAVTFIGVYMAIAIAAASAGGLAGAAGGEAIGHAVRVAVPLAWLPFVASRALASHRAAAGAER